MIGNCILWLLLTAPLLVAVENMEVTGRRVNIRKSPSTKGAVIGSVKAGDQLQVKEIKDGWARLHGRPGFVSASFLRSVPLDAPAKKPAPVPAKRSSAAEKEKSAPAKRVAPGQVFPDIPVVPGSKRDVTVRGMLFPVNGKGNVRYALLRAVGGKYAIQCYIYVSAKDAAKYKEFSETDVQLVGYWYKVPGWKTPIMQVRRLKGL